MLQQLHILTQIKSVGIHATAYDGRCFCVCYTKLFVAILDASTRKNVAQDPTRIFFRSNTNLARVPKSDVLPWPNTNRAPELTKRLAGMPQHKDFPDARTRLGSIRNIPYEQSSLGDWGHF